MYGFKPSIVRQQYHLFKHGVEYIDIDFENITKVERHNQIYGMVPDESKEKIWTQIDKLKNKKVLIRRVSTIK